MDLDIKKHSKLGFEFEFFTELDNNNLKQKLEKLLRKKIKIADSYHSDVKIDENIFKIEPDYSTGIKGKELITGPLHYEEAKVVMEKVLNFIRRYGSTSKKTAIHLNFSFDKEVVESLKHSFNIIKFILEFDEEEIYEKFPERKHNIYAKSIKSLRPVDRNFIFSENTFNRNTIAYPNEKYRGFNFNKITQDYLELRYLGGTNYEYKIDEINYIWEYALEQIYTNSATITNNFTEKNFEKLNEIYKEAYDRAESLSTYEQFHNSYPEIKLFVDLKNEKKFMDNKLYLIRDKINELFFEKDLKKGVINYDSEKGRFQLKNFELNDCTLEGVDLLNCKIKNCLIKGNSEIHKSEIKDSDIEECKLYKAKVTDTRIKNSFVNVNTVCEKSYIDGHHTFFYGTLKNSIFRKGYIMNQAKVDEESNEIIEFKKLR